MSKSLAEIFAMLQSGRSQEARQQLTQILTQQPNNADAHDLLGMVCLRDNQPTEAIREFQLAMRIGGQRADRLYHLALALEQQGRLPEAETAYRDSIALDNRQIPARHNLATLLMKAGRAAEALPIAEQSLQLAPNQSTIRLGLCSILEALGRVEQALLLLENVPPAQQNETLKIAQMRLLRSSGQLSLALAMAEQLVANNPGAAAQLAAAHTFFAANQLPRAYDCFANACEQAPQNMDAWINRSITAVRLNRLPEAEHAARTAIQLKPSHAMAHVCLANALSRRSTSEKMQEASLAAEQAVSLAPQLAAAWRSLGQVRFKRGAFSDAKDALAHAVALVPEDYESNLSLADCCTALGDLAAAEAILGRLFELSPNRADAPRQLGITKMRQHHDLDALVHLQCATDIDVTDQRAQAHQILAKTHARQLAADDLIAEYRLLAKPVSLPAPAGFDSIESFNAEFRTELLNNPSLRWEPSGLAARNGYLSEDLLNPPSPLVNAFITTCLAEIAKVQQTLPVQPGHPFLDHRHETARPHMWAVVLESDGSVDSHIHEESWLSCVYYVQVPGSIREDDPNCEGWLEFGMPPGDIRRPELTYPVYRICPKPGLLVQFPSYFYHRTLPYRHAQQRISVSFDLEPKK